MSKNEVTNTQDAMSPSNRFTQAVVMEFQSNSGNVQLTDQMKRLLQNYFVKLDSILKENETKRLKQSESSRDPLSFTWANVNMSKMAQECVSFAMLGLDPMLANHIFLIPYKNATTQKFDIGFLKGYRGMEIVSMKFGLNPPIDTIIEVIYENDTFKSRKKDANNPIESYTFEINDDFNRGAIKGGFWYQEFSDPKKNKLVTMTLAQIEKRKPKYASPEFWGGEKVVWENNKPTNKKEKIEGWADEMAYKTLARNAYNSITLDGDKINDHFVSAMQLESDYKTIAPVAETTQETVSRTIHLEANKEAVGFEFAADAEPEPLKKADPVQKDAKFNAQGQADAFPTSA